MMPTVFSAPAFASRNRPTVFFLHVPKTGGTTLDQMLARGFLLHKRHAVASVLEHGQAFRRLPARERASFDLVYGHFYFGLQTATTRPTLLVSMLREPVARVISHYYGNPRRKPDHYMHAAAMRFSLGEYLLRAVEMHPQGALEVDNFMVRLLAGEHSVRVPFGGVDSQLYEEAKRNLEQVDVLGLLERFEESVLLLQRALGWSRLRCLYTRKNVGSHPRHADLDLATRKALEERTGWDMALYEDARRIFAARLDAAGDALPAQLTRFQRELAAAEALTRMQRSVRQRVDRLLGSGTR